MVGAFPNWEFDSLAEELWWYTGGANDPKAVSQESSGATRLGDLRLHAVNVILPSARAHFWMENSYLVGLKTLTVVLLCVCGSMCQCVRACGSVLVFMQVSVRGACCIALVSACCSWQFLITFLAILGYPW